MSNVWSVVSIIDNPQQRVSISIFLSAVVVYGIFLGVNVKLSVESSMFLDVKSIFVAP